MGHRVSSVWFGKGSWGAALLLAFGLTQAACGDDPARSSPAGAGSGGLPGASGAPDGGGEGPSQTGGTSTSGNAGSSGSAPVTPGDLVCSEDDDCTSADKPVCDQVLGCVACQYDWDCPPDHRCQANECFEKVACSSGDDCAGDAAHPVCDDIQQFCVGCRLDTDCGDGQRCEATECVTFEACTNSRDCSEGKVCDRLVGACVGCVADGDCGEGSACVANACVPTCESDKDCLGIGLLCNPTLGRCVECVSHADCPGQYFCATNGHCSLDVCEPAQSRCESPQLLSTCAELGDQFVSSSCAGGTICVEDGLTASCVPQICTPLSTTCSEDGGSIVQCSADGLSVENPEPCLEGKACSEGGCVDVVCAPDTLLCRGNGLYKCNANGTDDELVQNCNSGQFGGTCNPDGAACESRTCNPNSAMCDGEIATTCDASGMGPAPEGEDCAAQDRVCHQGQCRNVVCEGDYVCEGSVLRQCSARGTLLQTVRDCSYPALCDAAGAKCLTPTCTPGAFVCDGDVATRCKPDGSGYVAGGQDCSESDLVCDGGGCLPSVCTPSSTFCAGGNPQKCGASGATYTPSDVCSTGEYCSETSTFCLLDKCTANAAVCNGNLLTTCASDGSGPLPGGTDCSATQQMCEAGACKPITCTSGSYSCQGEAVYVCNANGTGTSLYDSCSVSEFCDASGSKPVCSPDICTAGVLGCNGEVISTCGTNGGSWTSPGTNCKTSGQVCVLGGSCAAEEVATQGTISYSTSASNYAILSVFRALTSRKLSKLEAYVSFGGLQKVTWVVYEKRASGSAYDLVYQEVTSQTMPTAGYIVSPALDFTVQAGKSYAVGVHIAGAANFYYQYSSSSTYLAKGSFMTAPFASSVVSGTAQPDASITPYSDSFNRYFIRFTTSVAP